MNATLVFVHGRGQEAKNRDELKQSWLAGLTTGLIKANAPAIDPARAVFTYYGDVLHRITAEVAQLGGPIDLESLHPYLPDDTATVERELLVQMEAAAGGVNTEGLDQVLSWSVARRSLTWLARRTRLDQEIIKSHVRDVAVYLTRARDQILAEVRGQIPANGSIVLVSHSLGTVVARDLLDDDDLRNRITLWVTAGSPLGLEAVQRNLLTKGTKNPGVPWLTCYDVNDVVALGHPLQPTWKDPLQDIAVQNGDSPHSIERYLGHPEVAGPIGARVS